MAASALALVLMVLFAAAALAASLPQMEPHAATARAMATIRVVSAVRLKLDAPTNADAPPSRSSMVTFADGSTLAAKLIEFQ
jgi:hypothetical protein